MLTSIIYMGPVMLRCSDALAPCLCNALIGQSGSTPSQMRRKSEWACDIIRQDLKHIDVDEGQWYNEAVTYRESWRALCRRSLAGAPRGGGRGGTQPQAPAFRGPHSFPN